MKSPLTARHLADRLAAAMGRWLDDDGGSTALEFALLSPAFISILFAAVMSGVIFLAKSELDLVTQIVARQVMTGQVTSSSQLHTALCNATGGVFDCSKFMVNLTNYATLGGMTTATPTITYNSSGAVTNTWSANFGAAGSIMVMQVMYQFPSISAPLFSFASLSNGDNLVISTAVFVNE